MLQILTNGIKAGIIAGFILGIMNIFLVSPLIQEAETYEGSIVSTEVHHDHSKHDHSVASTPSAHSHGEGTFEPSGFLRVSLTILGTTLLGASYGVMLSCIILIALKTNLLSLNFIKNPWIQGTLVGLSGFLVLHGLPSIGFPPPLPGVVNAEADFDLRQAWWLKDVFLNLFAILTLWFGATALSKFSFGKSAGTVISILLTAILIWIPYGVIGIPNHSTESATPGYLQMNFLMISLGVNLIFWIVLSCSNLKLNQRTMMLKA